MKTKKIIEHDLTEIALSLQRIDALPLIPNVLVKFNLISINGMLMLGIAGIFFLLLSVASGVIAILTNSMLSEAWADVSASQFPLKLGFFAIPAIGFFILGVSILRVFVGLKVALRVCPQVFGKSADYLLENYFSTRRRIPKSFPTSAPRILFFCTVFPLTIVFYILAIFGTFAAVAIVSPTDGSGPQQSYSGEDVSRASAFLGVYVLSIVFVIVIWSICFALHRCTLRILSIPSKALLESDKRPPVILFRSFADDSAKVVHPFYKAVSLTNRLEEVIAMAAWRFGPVTGLGKPGELLPKLGAAREYYSEETWRRAVRLKISESGNILVIANNSAGLIWEIEEIRKMKQFSKIIFIFASSGSKHKIVKSRNAELIANHCEIPLNQIRSNSRHFIAAAAENENTVNIYSSNRCFRWDYEAALYIINERKKS